VGTIAGGSPADGSPGYKPNLEKNIVKIAFKIHNFEDGCFCRLKILYLPVTFFAKFPTSKTPYLYIACTAIA
jgi:hypothetical protein